MSIAFIRPVFRRKSNLFLTTNKFGEGHIPKGAGDQLGPGSYNIESSRKHIGPKTKEQSYRARLIFDLIRTKKRDESRDSKDVSAEKGKDLNEITLSLGCKRVPQVRKCNMARAPRFPKNEDDDKPGPGTYGNYYEKYEKKKFFRRCYQDFNIKMNIDRSLNLKQMSGLSPGMYNVNDKCCKKTHAVSWDNNPTSKSVWTDARDYLQSPGQYNIKTGLEELLSKNRYLGYFKKAPRFLNKNYERIMLDDICHAPRDPDEPGPAHYYPHPLTCKRAPQNLKAGLFHPNKTVAFNSTSERTFSFINNSIEQQFQPGPGRYYPVMPRNDENSYRSAFLSKGRAQTNKQFMSFKERIRSSSVKNIPECRQEYAYCCWCNSCFEDESGDLLRRAHCSGVYRC